MLKRLQQFFEQTLMPEPTGTDPHALHLAAVSLLFEMMRMDDHLAEAELEVLVKTVKEQFQLPDSEIQTLLELAEMESRDATDYFQFTTLINAHYSMSQKIQLVESLWRVAYADRHLDVYEEHMVRKIADLLYVPHKDFIAAKLRVQIEMAKA